MRGLGAFEAAFRRIENALMLVALAAFVVMVSVTTIDVGLRYIFNRPFSWTIPVTSNYLIVALYFCGIAATQRDRQHLGIDLFTRVLPPRVRAACAASTTLVSLMFCVIVAAFTADVFWTAWINDEVMPGIVAWPLWASHVFVPLGFGMASIRLFLQFVHDVLGALGHAALFAEPAESHGAHLE